MIDGVAAEDPIQIPLLATRASTFAQFNSAGTAITTATSIPAITTVL
jgi:hypothetical protein